MKSIRRIKKLFWIAVSFLFLMSGSILLMPVSTKVGNENRTILLLSGLMFWVSLTIGYGLLYMANQERKWFVRHKLNGDISMNCRAGIITFFDNIPATMADVTMLTSLLLFVCLSFTELRYEYISFVLLFLLVFSLNMHCLFNGRIYKVTKYKRTRREESYE